MSTNGANFNFHLNRQGPQGVQGEKGDTGFSPYISVDTNTAAEYKLLITNENNSFVTDNLRGSAVDDQGGTYMRYNPSTQMMFAGQPDYASDEQYGVVMLATDEDIELGAEDKAITAGNLRDVIETLTTNITSTVTTLETALAEETSTRASQDTILDNKITSVQRSIGNGTLTISQGTTQIGTFTANSTTNVTVNIPVPSTPNNGTLTIQKNGTTIGSFGADSSTDVTANITVPTQLSDLSDGTTAVTLTLLETTLQDYVETSTLTTTVTSTDTTHVPTAASVYDFVTTQVSGVTIDKATSTTLGTVMPDNSTITIDSNGVISSVGGSTTNMVTTNTAQDITGIKTFKSNINITPTVDDGSIQILATQADGTRYGREGSIVFNPGANGVGSGEIRLNADYLLLDGGNSGVSIKGSSFNRVKSSTPYPIIDTSMIDGSTIVYDETNNIISVTSQIDDTTTTTTSTWSSTKIEDEITTKVTEATSTMVTSTTVNSMVTISQADYDLLNPPDANTLYIITNGGGSGATYALADLSNISVPGKNVIADLVSPSSDIETLTIPTSGQSIIAPATGYLTWRGNASNGSRVKVQITRDGVETVGLCFTGNGGYMSQSCSVRQGDTITCIYGTTPDAFYIVKPIATSTTSTTQVTQ